MLSVMWTIWISRFSLSVCALFLCVGMHLGNRRSSQSGSRRQRAYSVGLGRRRTSRDSEEVEDTFNSTGRTDWMISPPIPVVKTLGHQQSLYLSDRDDTPASPCSLTSWDSSKYCCRLDQWKHCSVSVVPRLEVSDKKASSVRGESCFPLAWLYVSGSPEVDIKGSIHPNYMKNKINNKTKTICMACILVLFAQVLRYQSLYPYTPTQCKCTQHWQNVKS